ALGHAFLLRGIPLAVAGLVLVGLRRLRETGVGLLAAATLAAMLGDVLKSHAAASTSWAWLHVGEQWVHVVAAGLWIGGLAGLLLSLGPLGPGSRGPAARRFSFWAGIAIVVVGITGTLRAFDEVGSWHGLFHTGFGQLIVVKIALFGLLGLLGALNRFRNVRAVEASPRGLRRTGGAELVAMAAVLAATALLQNLAPARSAAAAGATTLSPVVIDASDFATTYRLHLTVTSDTPGFDTFTLTVSDYETRKPAKIDGTKITFHYTDSPAVGDSSLQLDRQPGGSYRAQGANLALVGHWLLTVNVSNGVHSVDVPMDIVTQTQPEAPTSAAFQGPPTVVPGTLPGRGWRLGPAVGNERRDAGSEERCTGGGVRPRRGPLWGGLRYARACGGEDAEPRRGGIDGEGSRLKGRRQGLPSGTGREDHAGGVDRVAQRHVHRLDRGGCGRRGPG